MIKIKKAAAVILGICIVMTLLLFLVYQQTISITPLLAKKYEVRGVDVSHYQGDIDWQVLSDGLDFAYIKATEGSSYVDDSFEYNYKQARAERLRTGAYHFFSFDSTGAAQAANFIENVEPYEDMLPPVIDLEYYGKYFDSPKHAEEVLPELEDMINALEKHYGVRPVIYVTGSAYRRYIRDSDIGCEIWRRNVYLRPAGDWTFWQYSSVGQLEGFKGDEKYIDLNVYCGTREDFAAYGRRGSK
ncbi:MAG: glycoside hydrolase [Saccharofermentans sp.]|nr:glycoside hydrolase [Saccharofermentans sp.]